MFPSFNVTMAFFMSFLNPYTPLKVLPFPLDREYFCSDKKWSKSFPESELTKCNHWKISTSKTAEITVLTDTSSVQVNTSIAGVEVLLFGLSRDNKIVSCWKIHFLIVSLEFFIKSALKFTDVVVGFR